MKETFQKGNTVMDGKAHRGPQREKEDYSPSLPHRYRVRLKAQAKQSDTSAVDMKADSQRETTPHHHRARLLFTDKSKLSTWTQSAHKIIY